MNDETNLEGLDSIIPNTWSTDAQQSQQKIESADVLAYEEQIYQFWDELCDFDIADTHEAMIHCLRSLADWIGAQNSFWIGAIRMLDNIEASADLMSGWRIKTVETLHEEFLSREGKQRSLDYPVTDPGDTTRAAVADAGNHRAYSLGTGFVDLKAFKKTEHYDFFYRRLGITDRIWVAFPVTEDSESYFLFDTTDKDRLFSEEEIVMVSKALRGIKWFHRQLLLMHGIGICKTPLSPSERRMVSELIQGDSEKVIAERLGLTAATVHQYATKVYRKYGVRGRAEFMALWLKGW